MSDFGGTLAVGEEAIVADAVKARGNDVEHEPADELVGTEGHDLGLVVVAVVLPREADGVFADGDQPR